MDPVALGNDLAERLSKIGFGKTATDVKTAAEGYADARQAYQLQVQEEALNREIAAAKGEGTGYHGTMPMGIPILGGSAYSAVTNTPFTSLQDVALKPHATGGDFILPGSGGEQPYVVSARPGERMTIDA
jgi:hypothetical protein